MSISDKAFAQIKTENISPLPRWTFLLRRSIFWSVFALIAASGALISAFAVYLADNNDWDMLFDSSGNIQDIWSVLPMFWIGMFAVFIIIANFYFRHSRTGYRFSPVIVGVAVLAGSLAAGGILNAAGAAEKMDRIIIRQAPYLRLIDPRIRMWDQPWQGRLTGSVVEAGPGPNFTILTPRGQRWTISLSGLPKKMVVMPRKGDRLKILGKVAAPGIMQVQELRPWFRPVPEVLPGRGRFLPAALNGTDIFKFRNLPRKTEEANPGKKSDNNNSQWKNINKKGQIKAKGEEI